MSLNDGLILHFVSGGSAPADGRIVFEDWTGVVVPITNQGVTLGQDAMFGLTLNFAKASSFLEIMDPAFLMEADFTLGGWVKFNTESGWVRLMGKGREQAGNESIGLWAQPANNTWWFSQQGTNPRAQINTNQKEIEPGSWYHIAGVRRGDTLTLYHNGEVLGAQTGLSGTPHNDPLPFRIGYNDEYEAFNGEMAHLRVYQRALSAGEIMQMINASGVAVLPTAVTSGPALPLADLPGSAFKRSHPVDFALFDQDNHYALYIDDGNALGQPLTFEVYNSSDRAMLFRNGQGSAASAANYHFELQFRPGVLSANTLSRLRDPAHKGEILTDPANWDLFVPAEAGPADHVSLFILQKGESTWPPKTRRSLRFAGINADAAGGSRGTQVALLTNQLTYADSDAPLTGRRTHHLSIVNHRGEKAIPLHVGFKGSNQVLNVNGVASSLTLQIVNNLRLAQTHKEMPAIALSAPVSGRTGGSRLILEVDVQQDGEDKSWALARASELNGMTIAAQVIRYGQTTADGSASFQVTVNTQSVSRQWTIAPQKDLALNPGDAIQIDLSGIVTSLPTGPTNLYVHYDDLGDYQNGMFTLPIIKSPLRFAGGNVGIGTATPAQKVDVAGGVRSLVHPAPNTLALYVSGDCQPAGGLAEFRHSNGTQGIGIGYNTLYATGGNPSQDLNLAARGSGVVRIQGSSGHLLQVEPAPASSVHIGRSPHNGIEFDYAWGQGINSTANITLNIDTDNSEVNERYIDFRANGQGFSGGASLMRIKESGAVSIGAAAYAAANNFVSGGALTIGNINQNYGGGTTHWNGNTAGLLLECAANTEIAVHDSHTRVASLLYYEGDNINRITMGRDMGWGKTDVYIAGNLSVEGGISKKFRRWWSLQIQDDQDWGNTRVGLMINAHWSNSDARLKEDIQPIAQALHKITQLNGVTYRWSPDGLRFLTRDIDAHIFAGPEASEADNRRAREEARQEACRLLADTEVGLLAQDVEQVLPQLVRTGEDGYKSIRYDLLSALLVEAVKELSREVERLKKCR